MSKITSSEYQSGYKAGYADAHREALEDIKNARSDALEEAAKHAQERWMDGLPIAEIPAAIRTLKETP